MDQAVEVGGGHVILHGAPLVGRGVIVTSTASQGPGNSQQQANSIQFWKEVADAYKGDGRVIFELYNEPQQDHRLGRVAERRLRRKYTAAGMQQLYDAVRGTGANNVVIAGGLDCSTISPDAAHMPRPSS